MDLLAIGKIRSPHGIKGFLKVMSFSGETGHFFSLKHVFIRKNGRDSQMSVEEVKKAGRDILVKLEGVDSPEKGKLFSGCEIYVERKNAAPLKKGEFYQADLVNCSLVFNGAKVGTVISVWNNGIKDYLEVRKEDDSVFMVPFINQFIGNTDPVNRTIILLNDVLLQ